MANLTLSANMDTLLQAADYSAARTTLGLAIGTDVQAFDAALTALAGGSDFVQFSGPATTTKVFTLPNATCTILTTNAAVTVAQGGTGIASGTSGGVPYFSAGTTIASSAALAANAIVLGGGAGAAPATTTTGTGVVTALGVAVGSAGAFVVNGGALGTPASGTATNITGLPVGGISATGTPSGSTFLRGDGTWSTPAGTGDVVGPDSVTDTQICLFDGATGKLIKSSVVTIDASGNMASVGDVTGSSLAVTTLVLGGTTVTATGAQINASAGAFTPASASGAASMALAEDTDNGTNTVSIAAPASVATNKTATLQDVTGTIYVSSGTDVAVADGGTGLSSGTSGGVLGFTASGTIASSAALAANAIVIGGGAGATPTTTTTGTGVLTALGVAVGSAGAFVTFNGALGTPSSGTLTSCTGLPASGIAAGILGANVTLGEGAGQIVLDAALSADGTYSGIVMVGTAGYTQAFGDVVYLDPTDSRWEACDANAAAGADGDCRGTIGMVVVAGTDGNSCTILIRGKIRADANFPTFTINNPIYISETAGDVTQTQPTTTDVVIRIIGAALTADEMLFAPDNLWFTHT